MYNAERKETYFAELEKRNPGSSMVVKYIFNTVSQAEELFEKDICDFTLDEINKVLGMFNAMSSNSLSKNFSILKKYCDWCCYNKLSVDNINHFTEFDTSNLSLYVNKYLSALISREDLCSLCKDMFNASDRFLSLALFEGVYEDSIGELLMLTLKNIDPGTRIVTFPSGAKKQCQKHCTILL